jgi:hypothetical protein
LGHELGFYLVNLGAIGARCHCGDASKKRMGAGEICITGAGAEGAGSTFASYNGNGGEVVVVAEEEEEEGERGLEDDVGHRHAVVGIASRGGCRGDIHGDGRGHAAGGRGWGIASRGGCRGDIRGDGRGHAVGGGGATKVVYTMLLIVIYIYSLSLLYSF